MADYFAALAARTLRPELSVQPRRRVRWEEAAEPMADRVPGADDMSAARVRPGVADEGEPPRRSRATSTSEPGPREREPVEPRPEREYSRRKAAGDPDATSAATASAPHPTVRALEPAVQLRFERVAVRQGDAPGKSPAVTGDRAGTVARAHAIERGRPRPARPSTGQRESTAEPAIRIHIGRVDVRAVTAEVRGSSPPAPRDSTRALMSLDEYVQKRDRGAS